MRVGLVTQEDWATPVHIPPRYTMPFQETWVSNPYFTVVVYMDIIQNQSSESNGCILSINIFSVSIGNLLPPTK